MLIQLIRGSRCSELRVMVVLVCPHQSEGKLTAVFALLHGWVSEVVPHTVVRELPICTCLESHPYYLDCFIEKDGEQCTQANTFKVNELAWCPEIRVESVVSYGKPCFMTVKVCMRIDQDLMVTGTKDTNLLTRLRKEDELRGITKHYQTTVNGEVG